MSASLLEQYPGIWVVVEAAAGKYFGRVASDEYGNPETLSIEFVKKIWKENGMIDLCPAFMYVSNLVVQQDRAGNPMLARDSAILPWDLTLSDNQSMTVVPTALVFMSNIAKDDAVEYQRLLDRCSDMLVKSRMGRSGLTIASSMPQNNQAGNILFKK